MDADHVYAVGNRRIQKLDKRTRVLLGEWPARDAGPGGVVHLNSGVVIDGRLYCAHSNYPEVPMASSVEIFDPVRMQHIGSHSFGIAYGSATWVDRRDGHWWVGFAHYEGRGGVPGMGPAWTRVVEFDAAWRRVAGYVFPPEVVERFGTRSNSGGAWGPDGLLYATGHDEPEVYVLRLPAAGSVLELVEILPITATGQGIAWDPSQPDVLYTIVKREREIVASRLVAD